MHDELRKAYNFTSWSRRARHGGGLVVRNFVPWAGDFEPLVQSTRDHFMEAPDRRLVRTVWDDPSDRSARILVEIRETESFEVAEKCLLEVLANNQLARLPEGPPDLGDVSFVHPEGVPPAAFWVIGNLCVSICSVGRKPIPVRDWAERLQTRLLDKPGGGKLGLAFEPAKSTGRIGQPTRLVITLARGQSPESCIKVFAPGADLSLDGDGVVVRPMESGRLTVEVYATEPGRRAAAGRTTLTVR
jgi:hypothetical protein